MVQDPNFWRRFSVAVHNDEAAMLAKDLESGGKREPTKHAYVVSLSSPIDSPASATAATTPTSQCHLSPAFAAPPTFPAAAFTRPLSAPASALRPEAVQGEKGRKNARKSSHAATTRSVFFAASANADADADDEKKHPSSIALRKLPSCPDPARTAPSPSPSTPKSAHFNLPPSPSRSSQKTKRFSQRASRFLFGLSSHPPTAPSTPLSTSFTPSHSQPNSQHRSSRRWSKHPNGSRLSLGVSLSGRPKSAFRFWTTITADASHRDSWLEGQQRKARQRTYMCWAFWLVFLVVVVGGVVAVLVLKGKGII